MTESLYALPHSDVGNGQDPEAGNPIDVLVVGAGPVGLALSLALARQNRRVQIIEKNSETARFSRAPAIWPATQEVLDRLGVIDRFLQDGIVKRHVTLQDADSDSVLLSVPIEELSGETPFPQLLILPQSSTENLLLQALQNCHSARVRFGTELVDLTPASDHVSAHCKSTAGEFDIAARLVVGCDGAHSRVRKLLRLDFPGNTFPFEASLADIRYANDDWHSPRLTGSPCPAIGIKITHDTWRLILPFTDNPAMSLDQRIQYAMDGLFGKSGEILWKSQFSLHNRVASAFSRGRIALAGDAAHLNSPVGGQGMNAGLQDTEPLASALIEVLETNDVSALDSYSGQRRQQIASNVNRYTAMMTRVIMFRRGRHLKLILRLVNTALKVPPLRRRFLRRLTMLRQQSEQ